MSQEINAGRLVCLLGNSVGRVMVVLGNAVCNFWHLGWYGGFSRRNQPSSIDLLRHHGLDPSALTSQQLALFENADAEQKVCWATLWAE
jgi:hypothetical protein